MTTHGNGSHDWKTIQEKDRQPGDPPGAERCTRCKMLRVRPDRDLLLPRREPRRLVREPQSPSVRGIGCLMKRPQLELFLYPWELWSMSDYSGSLPSGTTIGKVWRRGPSAGSFGEEQFFKHIDDYFVGMYVPDFDGAPDMIGIVWFKVVVRSGPAPQAYTPPDWSNYQQWLRDRQRTDNERVREKRAS